MPLRQFWCHLVRTLLYYSDKCRDQSELPIKWGSKILTMFFLVWADKNSVVNFFHFTLSAYNLSCLCLRWWQNNQELLLVATLLWRREWHPTPVLLPGKSHGWRSLVGCSPWGREESDMTERLHFHFSLSCFGEGNGNPLQGSCLENPRDGAARWAAVSGVAQSRTWLKRLSSSSSSSSNPFIIETRHAYLNLHEYIEDRA